MCIYTWRIAPPLLHKGVRGIMMGKSPLAGGSQPLDGQNIQNHGTPILRAPAPRALTVVLGCLPHTAPDVELILGLLRCCGFKIRQADPASLQEILKTVALTQVCFHVPPPYSQC